MKVENPLPHTISGVHFRVSTYEEVQELRKDSNEAASRTVALLYDALPSMREYLPTYDGKMYTMENNRIRSLANSKAEEVSRATNIIYDGDKIVVCVRERWIDVSTKSLMCSYLLKKRGTDKVVISRFGKSIMTDSARMDKSIELPDEELIGAHCFSGMTDWPGNVVTVGELSQIQQGLFNDASIYRLNHEQRSAKNPARLVK